MNYLEGGNLSIVTKLIMESAPLLVTKIIANEHLALLPY